MSRDNRSRVLVVDDDPTLRLIARATLEQEGFAVAEAADGDEASRACRALRPDIVLLDVNLPGRSGPEVCKDLREQGDGTPVLMMTACDDVASIRCSYDAGATDFIGKPLNWTILVHRIRHMLRASQDAHQLSLLAAAVREAAEGIAITTAGGVVLYLNPAFERITGYSAADAVGRTVLDLRDTKKAEALFARQADTVARGDVWKGQYLARRKDGSRYDQSCTISPVRSTAGDESYRVAVIRDVTRERQLERQLAETHRLEALGTLAGGIAHDFNNLLTPMLGYAEMSIDLVPQDAVIRPFLRSIVSAAERAKALVQQILAFCSEGEQARKLISLGPVLQEALAQAMASSPEPIDGRLEVARGFDFILAEPSQIHQLVLNLCVNAADAMRGRSRRSLELRVDNVRVEDAQTPHPALAEGAYVRLSVSDTGQGMSPGTLRRIFEPFFTTKEPGQGTGIGLAAAHGIVKSHGGAITVRSRLGEGTTFEVYFPQYVGEAAREEPQRPHARSQEKRTVLVVDDDEAVRNVAVRSLLHLGHSAEGVPGAAEALKAFGVDPHRYDLVMTDMSMQGMDGLDLARALLSQRSDVPIILCTGYSEAVTPEIAEKTGIREVLMKPWTRAQLVEALEKALDVRGKQKTA